MSLETIRGIIIKEVFSGESDKFITVFAKDLGKKSIYCKGARNTKSKFLSSTNIFTYGDFIIRTSSKTASLNSVDIIDSFYNIRLNYDTAVFASYLIELLDKSNIDNVADNNILLLTLKGLKKLCAGGANTYSILNIFRLQYLLYMGYAPDFDNIGKHILSFDAIIILNTIINLPLNAVFNYEIPNKNLIEINRFLDQYIQQHIDINLKSQHLLKSL